MAIIEMVMPKMGESVMEGTIIRWLKNVGDVIKVDESILEVATDKVDTEIPSTHAGTITKIIAKEGDIVQIGHTIAIISTNVDEPVKPTVFSEPEINKPIVVETPIIQQEDIQQKFTQLLTSPVVGRFYSPLVLNMAKQEGIPLQELELIPGTGLDGRLTKSDMLHYIRIRSNNNMVVQTPVSLVDEVVSTTTIIDDTYLANLETNKPEINEIITPVTSNDTYIEPVKPAISFGGETEIIEMDRMRKMIAQRMLESQQISAHVTSFVEADVTNLVYWRNKVKHEFMNKEGDALTLTPLFIEAIARAIKDYPLINATVEGDKIIVKKYINIGLAVALPTGNLIVPVIKNVDQLSIVGITKKVNDLAKRARENKITADELADGTYTMSNVGSFGNVMGTPIIVQPQIAIMAFGTVQKKPAVVETQYGDAIGIRHMMFLSHSYDHRVVDGALGGMFVRKVADYLEGFDINRKIW